MKIGMVAVAHRLRSLLLLSVLGCSLVPATLHAQPMQFAVTSLGRESAGACGRDCVGVISANGEITNGTADDFLGFLTEHLHEQALRPVVLLQSFGGTVVGAMKLGSAFRAIGALVIVGEPVRGSGEEEGGLAPAYCMSACVYALFGGKERVVPKESLLGIHRMVISENVQDANGDDVIQQTFGNQQIVSALAAYTKRMGINPAVIFQAEKIAPEAIHVLSNKEIARWRLAKSHL